MKNFNKLVAAATIVGILGVVGVAGASYAVTGAATPVSILSTITGQTVEQVTAERAAGKTYGAIAKDAGKLDQFKTANLDQRKAVLDQRVKDGNLTQAQADATYKAMETNQATCDGTGSASIGQKMGGGFGQGMGASAGQHNGRGRGMNTVNNSAR